MKRLLIYNYWLLIASWCMFLNDYIVLPILLGTIGCAILVFMKRRINAWRVAFLSIVFYMTISTILSMSNIPYYFSKFYIFLAIICLNLALTSERLYLFKIKALMPFLVIMLIGAAVLSIVAAILPDTLYTLFTKTSLYLMISIIFLPQALLVFICISYKQIKKVFDSKYLLKSLEMKRQRI